ncbi:hypothetical protein [Gryllotalpicola protaetiae]|uniref:Uncharacterized protein n=1 Tax=Gryllotalpicola protaetiae TaxID=2419771 RepID=A0A387C315_9MICO|nr:hypothetical protein [Gryllotalpicola protaetiae]AYG04941.1 hypothetical protein D7I44_16375 [Gryllotalpicola protaetiae]
MSALETRYEKRSVRAVDLPRAFTFGEFTRGAALAWAWFQPCVIATGAIIGAFTEGPSGVTLGLLPVVIGLPFTVVTTVVGSPIAYLLGRALERRRGDVIHLAAFAAYGMVLGAVVPMIVLGSPLGGDAIALMCGTAGAFALPLGWWTTSRIALRDDRRGAMSDMSG